MEINKFCVLIFLVFGILPLQIWVIDRKVYSRLLDFENSFSNVTFIIDNEEQSQIIQPSLVQIIDATNFIQPQAQQLQAAADNTQAPNRSTPNIKEYSKLSGNNRNEECIRIVIPFHISQLYLARHFFDWNGKVPPCGHLSQTCVHLHILVDSPINQIGQPSKLNQSVYQTTVKDIKTILLEFQSVNTCVKQTTLEIFSDGCDNYHIGSYRAFKHAIFETNKLGYKYMALMELDAYPIKTGWADLMNNYSFFEGPFFIKGTGFKLSGTDCPEFGHINGNCLYHVGNLALLKEIFGILDSAEKYLSVLRTGYDVLIYHLFISPYTNGQVDSDLSCGGGVNPKYWSSVSKYVTNSSLKGELLQGYIEIPYLINNRPNKRGLCQKLLRDKFLTSVQSAFPEHVLYHCKKQRKPKK